MVKVFQTYVMSKIFQANQCIHLDMYKQVRDLQLGSLHLVRKDCHMHKD